MGRPFRQGISFYRLDAGHILNKKVRLLYNEYGSDGYYIWSCLLDMAYAKWGYYFDTNDLEEMELFASEYCKKKVTLVQEVITGCIRRGLFDQAVADLSGVLTSAMMQETYVTATSDRRGKGTVFQMVKEWLLLDFSQEVPPNISIVPVNNVVVLLNNSVVPRKSTQSREEKKREEESREEKNTPAPSGAGEAEASPVDARKIFEGIEKTTNPICAFIAEHKPVFIEPYAALWNLFAGSRGLPMVTKYSATRKKKLAVRLKEKEFDLVAVLTRAAQARDFLLASKWFTFDWIIENESNYLKVLEGNYDKIAVRSADGKPQEDLGKKVEGLYSHFLRGQLETKYVLESHCDYLLEAGLIELDQRFIEQAIPIRIQMLTGSNSAADQRAIQAYVSGKWPADPDCKVDEPHRIRIAKKYALLDYFQKSKSLNRKTVTDVRTTDH